MKQPTGGGTQVEQWIGKDVDLGTTADTGFECCIQPDAFHPIRNHPRTDNHVPAPGCRKRFQLESIMAGCMPQQLFLAARLLQVGSRLGCELGCICP